MARLLACVLLVGCSHPTGPQAPPVAPPAASTRARAPARGERWIFRQLRVNTRAASTRTTFELVIDGNRANLIETNERAHRPLSIAEADAGARWTVAAQRTYRGSLTPAPGAIDLALESDGVQPLQLRCSTRAVDAAAAGALRVASSSQAPDPACEDRGAWSPATTTSVRALVCGAGLAGSDDDAYPDGDDHDDDDRLVFAAPPGLEQVSVRDACVVRGGLRILR